MLNSNVLAKESPSSALVCRFAVGFNTLFMETFFFHGWKNISHREKTLYRVGNIYLHLLLRIEETGGNIYVWPQFVF